MQDLSAYFEAHRIVLDEQKSINVRVMNGSPNKLIQDIILKQAINLQLTEDALKNIPEKYEYLGDILFLPKVVNFVQI